LRVLAARFPDRERASAALKALRGRLDVPAEDADIAPLGIPGLSDEGDDTLLAGRFEENHLELVRRTLAQAGGRVVADVDERRTRPRVEAERPKRDTRAKRRRRSQAVA
jgi:hypothetical protein